MAKISKSERIRHALSLKSNKDVSVADLAKTLKVQPGLIYALKWKEKNGKAKRKTQKQVASKQSEGVSSVVGSLGAGSTEHNLAAPTSVGASQPTITSMIATLQEALVVLHRVRSIVG